MRILMVNDVGTLHAGAEIMINNLRKGLRARGHEVRMLAGSERSNGAVIADERYRSYDDGSPLQAPLYMCNPSAVWRLWRNLRRFKPDIVHLHNVTKASPFIFWVLRRHATVFTAHDHTLLDPTRFDLVTSLRPYARTLTGFFIDKPSVRYYAEKLRYKLYRRWCPRVDRVLACSHFYKQCIAEAAVFDSRKIVVVPNGIELPSARPLHDWHTLLYVGRLDEFKGVGVLLAAMPAILAKHPQARLQMVGDGEWRNALARQATDLGVEHAVQFLGFKNQDEVKKLYANATLAVVPSLYADNFPTVCLEALAIGRPVVATKVGGIPEIIEDGKTGALVQPDDAPALAAAISRLFATDKTKLKAMATAGRERAEREYSAEVYVARTLAEYQKLIDQRAAAGQSTAG